MSSRTQFVAGVVSILLVATALGIYFYQRSSNVAPFAPAGKLLLSLAPKGTTEVNLYEYDIRTGELLRFGRDGNSNFDAVVAPDGNRIAHIAYGPGALASQVIVYDPVSGERRSITRGEAFRHSPDWSPVGSSLAFSQEAKGGANVFVAELSSSPRSLGAGDYPVWSLDGQSVFAIDQSGLVRYDLARVGPVRVWRAKGSGMKLSASADHSLLAWLIPGGGEVRLFKANPVKPEELLLNRVLKVSAYDLAFSPDNVYVAFRTLVGEGESSRYEIAIERLDTGERKVVLDLSPYEAKSLYLSYWK